MVLTLLCVMYALNYMVRVNVSTAAGAFKDELHLNNTDLGWIFWHLLTLTGLPNPQRLDQRSRRSAGGAYRIRRDLVRGNGIYGLGQQHGCHDFWQGAAGHRRVCFADSNASDVHMDGAREARLRARNHAFGGAAGERPHASGRRGINRHSGVARIVCGSRNREPGLGNCVGLVLSRRSRRSSLDEGIDAGFDAGLDDNIGNGGVREGPDEQGAREGAGPFPAAGAPHGLVTVVYFCYGWTLWFFLAWVPQFFLHNYRLNLNHSALFSGGVFLAGVLGDFSGGVVSDRIFEKTGDRKKARRNLIIFGFLCSLVMMLPIVLVHNLTSAAIFLSLAFFFAEFTVAPMWAIPMDIAPNFSGFASGFMNSGSALAAIISPVLAGNIIDATGNWELPFFGSIGLAFVRRHPGGLDEDRGDAQRAYGQRRARGAAGRLMAKLSFLLIPNPETP